MTLRPGVRGEDWTPQEVAELKRLTAEGCDRSAIAQRLRRTISAVENKKSKLKLIAKIGPAPAELYATRYEVPKPRRNDDGAHLTRVLRASSRYGFPRWSDDVMARVYRLETAPVIATPFWRRA